jgi:hypothetical protein
MKLKLTAPGIQLLKLNRDKPLSKLAFRFYLRRYTKAHMAAIAEHGPCPYHRMTFAPMAGPHTRLIVQL